MAAGFDRFAPALVEQYLGRYAKEKLGISLHDLLAMGRLNPNDSSESFNMAYLAIRGSGAVNGVSRLHGEVSRHLFESLFPRWPVEEVPVGYVTNGIHTPTWDSAAADDLWTEACGKDRWLGTTKTVGENIRRVSDVRLWQFRTAARKSLVEFARERLSRQLAVSGASPEAIESAKHLFDPNALTLGFARRFATYKRPNLLLHDRQRLLRLLANPDRPVQIIIAGKAHPEDQGGQALIHEWIDFIRQAQVQSHIIFLSDYDMFLTQRLVQGVDVWINTPRRPWEACGTSGMKVLVNGGINLSELDGWWAEAYFPDLGWAIGDGQEHGCRSGLGRRGSGNALSHSGTRSGSRVLCSGWSGNPDSVGGPHAGKHGEVDASILRQSRGARIYRATLPSGCEQLSVAYRPKGSAWKANGRIRASTGKAMDRATFR